MLSFDDLAELAGAICATAETLGQTISASAAKLMAEDLSVFSPLDIRKALQSCRRELTGKLTLAAILQRISAEDGRPGKDEAWAIALASSDEFESTVLTDEILRALGAAQPVLRAGDKIGARMAFMSAYERFVADARKQALPVNWNLSVGFDPNRRIAAVEMAIQMQRIPLERAQVYLADLTHEPVTEDGRAIAGLITGEVCKPSEEVRERLKEIRTNLAHGADRKRREARLERVRIYLRKRELRAQVRALRLERVRVYLCKREMRIAALDTAEKRDA